LLPQGWGVEQRDEGRLDLGIVLEGDDQAALVGEDLVGKPAGLRFRKWLLQ
jgi:hypothetical protein